jgi:hypothetical protein
MRFRCLLVLSLLAILLVGLPRWFPDRVGYAQPTQPRWSHLQVFTYANTLLGVFDTRDGRLYMYNSGLANTAEVHELQELGKPLKQITQ